MALVVNPEQTHDDPAEDTAAAPDAPTVVLGQAPAPDPEPDAEPDSIVLFELDGVQYFVPRKPGPNVALAYLRDVRRNGEEYARAGLLERFIGAEGMDALADYEDLTDEDMTAIWALVEKHVLGGVNRGKAPTRPADRMPRRSPAGKR